MLFAIALVDVLIPLVAGLVALLMPARPKPPKLTEEKARKVRTTTRICGAVLIGVAALYFLIMLAHGKH